MQTKRNKLGYEMMLLPSLESFIPEDHYLRRLDRVLNLDFIHELVADKYCQNNGRPSIDPEVVIRLFLIQHKNIKVMSPKKRDMTYRTIFCGNPKFIWG